MSGSSPALRAGLLLGFGFGGFVDGIVMHQILQWHHMVSARVTDATLAGLQDNTLADGIFHAVTWAVALAGSLAAVGAWRSGELAPPWRVHLGAMLAGWGAFNLVDSVNHFVLGLHHVRDDLGGPVGWDVGFLVLALAQLGVGAGLAGAGGRRSAG